MFSFILQDQGAKWQNITPSNIICKAVQYIQDESIKSKGPLERKIDWGGSCTLDKISTEHQKCVKEIGSAYPQAPK